MINCKALSWNLLFDGKLGGKQFVGLEHLLYPRHSPRLNTWDIVKSNSSRSGQTWL